MKKLLLLLTFTLTCLYLNAFELNPSFINSNHENWSDLSEEETIAALHITLGVIEIGNITLAKLIKSKANCNQFRTKKENSVQKEKLKSIINTIKYKTPKIEALKEELEKLSDLMLSREQCEAQQALLEAQKAALEKIQQAN